MPSPYEKALSRAVKTNKPVILTNPSVTRKGNTTCPQCIEAARKGTPLPPEHPNAVLEGSTFYTYGELNEMVGADYHGPAVLLETSKGYKLTIGPNHPILTQRGLVKACKITKDDYLVYDSRTNNPVAIGHPYFDKIPMVENVFESLLSSGSQTFVATPSHDFHGDRIFCEGEVEVVKPTGSLLPITDSFGIEKFRDSGFVGSDKKPIVLTSDSSFGLDGDTINLSSSGIIGGGLPCYEFLHVLIIQYVDMKCKAFDATTGSGLYNSNGFVVSNCRCKVIDKPTNY